MSTTTLKETNFTLATWLDAWMVTYKECNVKENTYEVYKFVVSIIKKCTESDLPLHIITEIDLQKILNELFKKKYSKSTITKARYTLRQCFNVAFRLQYVVNKPSEYLTLPDAPTKTILPLTFDEQALVEKACHNDPLGHLFIFLLRTGLRRSELINLRWDDYDATNQDIHIRKSKTKAGIRTISLVIDAQKIIENQPHINNYIFNNTRCMPITKYVLRRLYERLRDKTGIMYLTNHVCRHTFVTRLCEKSVSAKAIAQIIGHSKTDYVMDIYALIEKSQLKLAIHKLDNASVFDNQYIVKLPPSLYFQAANCAISKGLAIDTLVAQSLQFTLFTQNNVN